MTTAEVIRLLEHGNGKILYRIFTDLITEHITDHATTQKELWEMYDGDREIANRELTVGTPDYKSNNKLSHDLPGIVIDQGVTYTYSKPIVTQIEESETNEKSETALKEFRVSNSMADLDLKTGLYSSTSGTTGRLCYFDKDGVIKVTMIKPWEVVYIRNSTTDEVEYAMIYYKIWIYDIDNNKKVQKYRVEWYDKDKVYFYLEDPAGQMYKEDPDEPPIQHGFAYVPVIEFPNNDLRKGDYEKVVEMMDAYDRLISDAQNELEDNRNAYMVFKGVIPDEAIMKAAKLTGAFGSDDDQFTVEWLIKELSAVFHENHKKTIKDDIYQSTKRVDMSDEKFSGSTQSGEGRKWKLLALENDASMKETKFISALREMYKVVASGWKKSGITIDYLTITFQFTRNLPVDLAYYGDILTKYFGKVPLKILYSLLPFIDDPETAIATLLEEQTTVGEIIQEPADEEDE